jgi:hypothetical protein
VGREDSKRRVWISGIGDTQAAELGDWLRRLSSIDALRVVEVARRQVQGEDPVMSVAGFPCASGGRKNAIGGIPRANDEETAPGGDEKSAIDATSSGIDVTLSEANFTLSEASLTWTGIDLGKSEKDEEKSENDLTQSEKNLTSSEENVTSSEDDEQKSISVRTFSIAVRTWRGSVRLGSVTRRTRRTV